MKSIYNKVASAFGAYGFNYPDGTTEVNDLGICNWLRAVVRRPWELTGVGNCFDQTLYAFWLLREEGIAREDIKVLICAGTVTGGGCLAHMTLIFKNEGKWHWVENTMPFPEGNGAHTFDTYPEAVEAVKQTLYKVGFADFRFGFKEDIQIEPLLEKRCGYLEVVTSHLPDLRWLKYAPLIQRIMRFFGLRLPQ